MLDQGAVHIKDDGGNLAKVYRGSILSGYRASIPRESRNIKGTEMFRALLAAKRLGNVHLPRPSARQLEVINEFIQGAPGTSREQNLG
jgi:hypothetical protein